MEKGIGREEGIGVERGLDRGLTMSISNLMKSMQWDENRAMDALAIPEDQRPKYSQMLSQQSSGDAAGGC